MAYKRLKAESRDAICWSVLNRAEKMQQIRSRIWFGTQYYRPPQPLAKYWEDDFRNIKDSALDIVRFWIYWRWMERQPGRYFWDDTDRLFDLAEKHGLSVHPLLFLESAPEWFVRAHPEAWLTDHTGKAYCPGNRRSTQIGGMSPCGNHPTTIHASGRFLKALVRRYRNRPSLMCWDAWNELQVKPVGTACACSACRADFSASLRARFGSLTSLNDAMKTGYGSWDDVIPPNGDSDHAPWFAWRRWQAQSLARQALWRKQVIQSVDPRQVVMIHMPTKLAIPGMGCGDWDACVPHMDFGGNSTHLQRTQRLAGLDGLVAARNVMVAEHAITAQQSPRGAWACEVSSDADSDFASPPLHPDDMAYWMWQPISQGIKGVLLWQYRAEAYGPEAWGLGLLDPDGSDTPRRQEASRIAATVRRHHDLFVRARPPTPEIGILTNTDQHLATVLLHSKMKGCRDLHQRSILNLHRTAWQTNLPVAFVQPGAIPANIRLLWVPHSPAGTPALRQALLDFLHGGGTAVIEGGLGNPDGISFQYDGPTPGLGLDKIFGLTEDRNVSTQWFGVTPGAGESRVAVDSVDQWLNFDARQAERALDSLKPELRVSMRWNGKPFHFAAAVERRPLRITGATVIGTFGDGAPAIATHKIGAGRVIYIGTRPSHEMGSGYAAFLLHLASSLDIRPPLPLKTPAGVTWQVLNDGNNTLLFVFNHLNRPQPFSPPRGYAIKILYGKSAGTGSRLTVGPLETLVCHLSRNIKVNQ